MPVQFIFFLLADNDVLGLAYTLLVRSPLLPPMNEPAVACGTVPPPLKHRKRRISVSPPETSDDDFQSTTMSGDGASDDEGFTKVLSRRARRLARKCASPQSSSTVLSPTFEAPLTVVFTPRDPTCSLGAMNKLKLSRFLEALAPGLIKEARVNSRKNLIAVDANNVTAVDILLATTSLCGADVRAYLPRAKNTVIGVIRDVDADIPDEEISQLVSSTVVIVHIRRFGSSNSVKLVFQGDTLPATVKVGLVRHAVRQYVPRPLQCRKCMKLGHVIGVCPYESTCGRCGENHTIDACISTCHKCANCAGDHEATSPICPRLRREMKICQKMARDHSSHKEAATHLRNVARRYRRRTLSLSRSRSRPRVGAPNRPPKQGKVVVTSPAAKEQCHVPSPVQQHWPALPTSLPDLKTTTHSSKPQQAAESATKSSSSSVTAPQSCDSQIISLLKTLISIIRSLLVSLPTPTGKTAAQILDGLAPLVDCLAQTHVVTSPQAIQ